MEKEDPIARIERERAEKKSGGSSAKVVAIILGVLLAIVAVQDIILCTGLAEDKKDLTERILTLQSDYNQLETDNADLRAQLDSSRAEVALLIENLRKTEVTNRQRMRKYEKEVTTLRNIMRNYVTQIDSLNARNARLASDLQKSKTELSQSQKRNEQLGAQVKDLTSKVAIGAIVKARDIEVIPQNASGKQTDRSSRVVNILVNMIIGENDLTPKGELTFYVILKDPEGNPLYDGTNPEFKVEGETLVGSASRTIDYQGSDIEVGIYVNDIGELTKGLYSVEIFAQGAKIGSAETLLR